MDDFLNNNQNENQETETENGEITNSEPEIIENDRANNIMIQQNLFIDLII